MKKPAIIFLSFFGVGYFPIAPGTAGTIAALPFLYYFGISNVSGITIVIAVAILSIISSIIADQAQKKMHTHDPSWIVIDEVLGISCAWPFLISSHWSHLLIIFILFRFFDITKIWPASYFDKKIENGAGIILDDIVSGIYSGLVYILILKLLTYAKLTHILPM